MGKLQTLAMIKLDPLWPDREIWGPRPLILFKQFNTAPLHSFKLMGPKFKLRNFRCHASCKRKHRALNLHCSSYISNLCNDYQCLILVFSVTYVDSWGYIGHGPRPGIWKISFSLSFPSFFLFYSSFSFFPLSLGGPFSSGAPGHCPTMPPSRYATALDLKRLLFIMFMSVWALHPTSYV